MVRRGVRPEVDPGGVGVRAVGVASGVPVVVSVVVVTIAFGWALGSLRPTLVAVAVVGATLAVSAAARGRARVQRASAAALPDACLAQRVEGILSYLDPIEHHRIDEASLLAGDASVAARWPQLWVGPTGLRVVDVCSGSGTQVCPVSAAARASALDELVDRSRATLAGRFDDVDVRAIVVTPDGTRCGVGCCPVAAEVVAPSALSAAITSGAVLAMPRVEELAARLAAALTDHPIGSRARSTS